MRQHTGQLMDRYIAEDGVARLRVQTDAGRIVEVRVPETLRAEAACLWGRGRVSYTIHGRTRIMRTLSA